MFDDPNKELKRLEEQLLAAKESDAAFEKFYSEIYKEYGPKRTNENLVRDVPKRSAQASRPAQTTRPSQASRPAQSRAAAGTYADHRPAKKETGIGGLAALVCFECLGIAAVVLWWVVRIL